MNRRAFSLTDLLAVAVAAALAVVLLVPAMKRNRDGSLLQVSQARLAANAQAHLGYAASNADAFVYRFMRPQVTGQFWAGVVAPGGNYWSFDSSGPWKGEFLGASQWWALHLNASLRVQRSPAQISPCDSLLLARHKKLADPSFRGTTFSVDSSYWLTPTVWFVNSRYDPQLATRSDSAYSSVRSRRVSEISFPSEKVLLMERWSFFDSVGNRVASPQVFARSSGWTNVVMGDGSVRLQAMSAVQSLADSPNASINRVFRPSGRWVTERSALLNVDFYFDGLETPNDPPWAFFWATRNGLAGRDIDRTGLVWQAEGERLMRFKATGLRVESPVSLP